MRWAFAVAVVLLILVTSMLVVVTRPPRREKFEGVPGVTISDCALSRGPDGQKSISGKVVGLATGAEGRVCLTLYGADGIPFGTVYGPLGLKMAVARSTYPFPRMPRASL